MTPTLLGLSEQTSIVTPTWVRLAELLAAVLFILALKGLSSPKSARRGNLLGAAGAAIATAVVFFYGQEYYGGPVKHLPQILIAIAIGSIIGWIAARRVQMTQMPQMVALFNGVGGGAAAVSSLAAPAIAGGHARTLTMVTSWPRGFAVLDDAATYFNEAVNAMSGGELIIEKKAPGELVGAFEVFDAVTSGQADMYHSADYYFLGQHPGYAFYTAVPFGATAQELTNWYYHDGGQDLHDELGSIFGLKSFLCGNSGSQSGGWFRKEIKSAQDLAGLRFRMPGLGGQVLGKLGVSVQNIPGGELYQALSSGALDGLEWVGPFADERAGFQEVAKVYYTAGFHEPGSGLACGMNLDVWNDLSDQHKAIIDNATKATTHYQLSQTLANNGAALARLQAQGVQTLQFSDDVWDAFGAASKEVLDENMGDDLFARIRNSFDASLAKSSDWILKSDGEFVSQRNRVLANG